MSEMEITSLGIAGYVGRLGGEWGGWLFSLITFLILAAVLADLWVGGARAKMSGASLNDVISGLIFSAVGMLTGGMVDAVIGSLLGTFLVELAINKQVGSVARATLRMGIGCGALIRF